MQTRLLAGAATPQGLALDGNGNLWVAAREAVGRLDAPGEIVLTNGHYTIQHDATVRLVNKPGGDTPKP